KAAGLQDLCQLIQRLLAMLGLERFGGAKIGQGELRSTLLKDVLMLIVCRDEALERRDIGGVGGFHAQITHSRRKLAVQRRGDGGGFLVMGSAVGEELGGGGAL